MQVLIDIGLDPDGLVCGQLTSATCDHTFGGWLELVRLLEELAGTQSTPRGETTR